MGRVSAIRLAIEIFYDLFFRWDINGTFIYKNAFPRILLTIIAVALIVAPATVDFVTSYVTNPLWASYGRVPLFWQVINSASINMVMLPVLWVQFVDEYQVQLYLVAIAQCVIIIPFFKNIGGIKLFEDLVKDRDGIQPFKFSLVAKTFELGKKMAGIVVGKIALLIAIASAVSPEAIA